MVQEWKNLLLRIGFGRPGGWKTLAVHGAVVGGFGILLPWRKGFDFLDAFMILAYACLALLFAAPATAQSLAAGGRADSMTVLVARIVMAVIYGWGMSVILLAAGLATVNYANWHGELLHPDWKLLAAVVALGLAGSLFTAALAALITLLFSAAAARNVTRLSFLAVLLLIVFRAQLIPDGVREWFARSMTTEGLTRLAWIGAVMFLALSAGLLATLRAPFTRPE